MEKINDKHVKIVDNFQDIQAELPNVKHFQHLKVSQSTQKESVASYKLIKGGTKFCASRVTEKGKSFFIVIIIIHNGYI